MRIGFRRARSSRTKLSRRRPSVTLSRAHPLNCKRYCVCVCCARTCVCVRVRVHTPLTRRSLSANIIAHYRHKHSRIQKVQTKSNSSTRARTHTHTHTSKPSLPLPTSPPTPNPRDVSDCSKSSWRILRHPTPRRRSTGRGWRARGEIDQWGGETGARLLPQSTPTPTGV